jgi:transcriptional regulator with PAS, ATPase and Fis domain
MIGRSYAIRQIQTTIKRVAPTTAPVLITGESGTGKELVATTIHANSPRRERPFIAINCAAIPQGLIESELFGHERGAFTGANQARLGCFELANTGTLFLDEITEMPADAQAKLLRVLQDKRLRRIGGSREISADVRVLAASNRNLARAMRDGTLREDLFFRLNVVPIEIPPLRQRIEDVALLVEEFVREFSQRHGMPVVRVEDELVRALEAYAWPGNVRELQNVIERAVIFSRSSALSIRDLPKELTLGTGPAQEGVVVRPGIALKFVEDELFAQTLAFTRGNKTRTAKMLGISRRAVYYRLERLNGHLANGHLNGNGHRNGRNGKP